MNTEQILSACDFDLDLAFVNILDSHQKHVGASRLLNDLASLVRCRSNYIERIKNRSKTYEREFLSQEKHIWDLLEIVSRIQPSDPPAVQCSQIKAFIEGLPRSNKFSILKNSENIDSLNESIFENIRCGNTEKAIEISQNEDEPWRTMLLMRYIDDINRVKNGDRVDWLPDQRTAWRNTYELIYSRDNMSRYESALHGIIMGDTKHVLPVCQSWEDVVWTYYNARVLASIDKQIYGLEGRSSFLLNDEFVKLARTKDDSISNANVLFFHDVALAILTGNIHQFIAKLDINERFDTQTSELTLRFLSGLIIYYHVYMNEPLTNQSNAILRRYAELNGKQNVLRPKILAYYASHLPKTLQVDLVSNFLSNFNWDEDEQSILFDMGRQFKLDMVSIARRTATKEIESFMKEENSTQRRIPRAIHFDDDDISERAKRCLRSFKWLLMDEALYFEAVCFANQLIRHALATKHNQLAEAVLSTLPVSITNVCVLQLRRKTALSDELNELDNYRRILLGEDEKYA
ncbi:107-domain-containing protein [Phascolomyces articulosus]|uniref:Nuclear pore complex protein n=1 Tax=Phascolomyces articulosus TaxID=60185 RepID=A0AAD5JT23_9FUNG|nr:107-domain-containing protein [Phascolomyces articulosus]